MVFFGKLEGRELGCANQSSDVQASLLWYPIIDFSTLVKEAEALGFEINTRRESSYMGFDVDGKTNKVKLVNSTTYIDKGDGAFFVQAGLEDDVIPYTQCRNFFKKLKKAFKSADEFRGTTDEFFASISFRKKATLALLRGLAVQEAESLPVSVFGIRRQIFKCS
ncbi:MAG: hypothetical protein AAGA18_13320 [Verrucomicrobiota bacterium]